KRIKIKQTKNIVMGLSSAELGYHKKESDFSWLVKNGILESKDVIYIFQNNIPKEARKLNHERGIIAYSERELLSTIESSKKIILIVNQISSLLKHLVKCDFEGLYLYKVETEFRFWSPLIKKINPINVLYSLAQGWPELHIVPFLSHHNIKTSNWFYGAGEFAYKTSSSQFNDNNIRFCLREADQTLVWNELTRKLLNDRQWIQTKNKIHVYGPVMNGCWNNLKLQKNIEKFTIVVFDSESMKSHARLQRGHGPFYELSTQEGFYKGIQDLLKKYPDAKFIIKGKKPITNNPLYHDVSSLNELKNMANGNVTFEELKTDPLSLISIADLVISSPFTSPGLAAIALGVPSIYYDSTKFCKSTFKNAFDSITLNTSQELINVVEKVKNNEFKFTEDALAYFNQISPDEMSSKIKDLL
ncbi:MAG: hypothetical protein HN576_09180, partial [Bacteriovoracaceae bacterium]|nr:hypothetical protein [Bacteriovoracaceae bacterium]